MLAISVVVVHTWPSTLSLSEFNEFNQTNLAKSFGLILPMFFALSGFLVSGSLERTPSIRAFAGLRVLRLWPALVVEIILSAFILGPIFTTYAMHDYFADPKFARYFFNLLGHPQYELAGVFESNPHKGSVNSQLWTLPYELYCYVALIGCSILGFYKKGLPLIITTIFLQIVTIYLALQKQDISHGLNLVSAFLCGVIIYKYRTAITFNVKLFFLLFFMIFVMYCLRGGEYLSTPLVAYITVFLGLCNPRRSNIVTSGDYSYGVYLYGFPVQQAFAALGVRNWFLHLALSLSSVLVFAAMSWWVVEKRALKLRRFLTPSIGAHRVAEVVTASEVIHGQAAQAEAAFIESQALDINAQLLPRTKD